MTEARLTTELNGDKFRSSRDWDWIVNAYRGFTPEGTFISPYNYLISFDGTDYYASNAYQTVIGGPDGIVVDGADALTVIHATIAAASAGDKIVFYPNINFPITAELHGITVNKKLIIDANGASFTDTSATGLEQVFWLTAADVELYNAEVDGDSQADNGVQIQGVANCTIANCAVHDCHEYGIQARSDTTTADYCRVLYNKVYNITGGTYGTGIKWGLGAVDLGSTGCKIIGNTIYDVAEHGIKFYNPNSRCVIEANDVSTTGNTGISVSSGGVTNDGNIVANNTIKDSTGPGIYSACPSAIITGNRIIDAVSNGIDINAAYNTVTGNNVVSTSAVGIRVASNYNTFGNNTISAGTGYYLTGNASYNSIHGGTIYGDTYRSVNEAAGCNYNVISGLRAQTAPVTTGARTVVSDVLYGTAYKQSSAILFGSAQGASPLAVVFASTYPYYLDAVVASPNEQVPYSITDITTAGCNINYTGGSGNVKFYYFVIGHP